VARLSWTLLAAACAAAACASQRELPSTRCCGEARNGDGGGEARADGRVSTDASEEAGVPSVPPRAAIEPRPLRSAGCARDVARTGAPAADVAELVRWCAQGLRPVARQVSAVDAGGPYDLAFQVLANRCVRAVAASDGPALAMTLIDDAGRALATGGWGEPLAVLPLQGPVCVRAAGTVHVVITAAAPATVVVALYQSSAP
jgi:hypothetical protein